MRDVSLPDLPSRPATVIVPIWHRMPWLTIAAGRWQLGCLSSGVAPLQESGHHCRYAVKIRSRAVPDLPLLTGVLSETTCDPYTRYYPSEHAQINGRGNQFSTSTRTGVVGGAVREDLRQLEPRVIGAFSLISNAEIETAIRGSLNNF